MAETLVSGPSPTTRVLAARFAAVEYTLRRAPACVTTGRLDPEPAWSGLAEVVCSRRLGHRVSLVE
jgi:hypothetical protein